MVLSSQRVHVADEPAPQALKKYRVLGQLAKGGMAELFLARADGIGGFERLLVIKRILPALRGDTELVRMLLDEARTAATLTHNNIVQVFDVDMVDGNVFYAMEYLHGHHVLSLIERSRASGTKIPLENAVSIAVAVAAGLHYAHERWGADGKPLDIVHRDVAPNNVIVTYDGNVKLIDFGIAKSANNLSTTRFGLFKGKLPYASPEQCRCEPVDRRTDVYSLGVLLYELTTGFPLFAADSEYELLRLMTEAIVPRPRMRDKSYPRELEQIVLKALAKAPADRYQTAQAMQRDLEVFASKQQLDLSAFSLSRLMAQRFGSELDRWKDSQSAGLTLAQHITKTTGLLPVVDPTGLLTLDDLIIEPPAPAGTERVRRADRAFRHRLLLAAALVVAGAVVGRLVGAAFQDDRVELVQPAPRRVEPVAPMPPPPPAPPAVTVTPIEPPPVVVAPAPAEPPPARVIEHAHLRPAKKRVKPRPAPVKHVEPAPADDLDALLPPSRRSR